MVLVARIACPGSFSLSLLTVKLLAYVHAASLVRRSILRDADDPAHPLAIAARIGGRPQHCLRVLSRLGHRYRVLGEISMW